MKYISLHGDLHIQFELYVYFINNCVRQFGSVVELLNWVSLFNKFYLLLVAIAQTECDIASFLSPAPDSFKVQCINFVVADCSSLENIF